MYLHGIITGGISFIVLSEYWYAICYLKVEEGTPA